jgi:hypothetical protein
MKNLLAVLLLSVCFGSVFGQDPPVVSSAPATQEKPFPSWRFSKKKTIGGASVVTGARIISIEISPMLCAIHVQTVIASYDKNGVEMDAYPVEGKVIQLTGNAYKEFVNAAPTPGLTRHEDLMAAAYRALIAYQANSGTDWSGSMVVKPSE